MAQKLEVGVAMWSNYNGPETWGRRCYVVEVQWV